MNKYGKRVWGLLVVLSLMLLAACGGTESVTDEEDTSNGKVSGKFGVVTYLTGAGAAYGEAITNGFNLAANEINAKGEVEIELVIEDSAGKQEQALTAGNKLMSDDSIVALLGPTLSTEFTVVAQEADLNGIAIMGTSTTAQGIPQIGDYVFRNSIPESLAIPAAME